MAVIVNISKVGNGKIFLSGQERYGDVPLSAGTAVEFKAVPDSGWKFEKWVSADGIISYVNPLNVTVTVDGSITGHFIEQTAEEKASNIIVIIVVLIALYFMLKGGFK